MSVDPLCVRLPVWGSPTLRRADAGASEGLSGTSVGVTSQIPRPVHGADPSTSTVIRWTRPRSPPWGQSYATCASATLCLRAARSVIRDATQSDPTGTPSQLKAVGLYTSVSGMPRSSWQRLDGTRFVESQACNPLSCPAPPSPTASRWCAALPWCLCSSHCAAPLQPSDPPSCAAWPTL